MKDKKRQTRDDDAKFARGKSCRGKFGKSVREQRVSHWMRSFSRNTLRNIYDFEGRAEKFEQIQVNGLFAYFFDFLPSRSKIMADTVASRVIKLGSLQRAPAAGVVARRASFQKF